MEFKGTPAPWNYNDNIAGAIEGSTDDLVACAYPMHYENKEKMKANAHLIAAAPELLEALIQAADYMWEDTRDVKFDGTMMFPGYLEFNLWEELHTKSGSFAIWDTGLGNGYHAYGGNDAVYWSKGFETRKEAQNAVIKHLIDIEPNHPAVLAHLAIAKALGQQ